LPLEAYLSITLIHNSKAASNAFCNHCLAFLQESAASQEIITDSPGGFYIILVPLMLAGILQAFIVGLFEPSKPSQGGGVHNILPRSPVKMTS